MSDATHQALHDAIQAHVADENGDGSLVSGWVVTTTAVMPADADTTSYQYVTSDDQPLHVSIGLIHMAWRWFDRYVNDEGDE